MKIKYVVLSLLVVAGSFFLIGRSAGHRERDRQIHDIQHVYIQEPSVPPKKEHMLRVIKAMEAKRDSTELRNDSDTWRIYVSELDCVLYLEQRPAN